MKFYCDNCQAKYSISDDKVRGKVLKVRCKKCSYVITVREPRAPVAAQPQARQPAAGAAVVPWYYALNGQTFGPYEESALVRMFESGELGDACYVWNETFTAWLPVRQVPLFVPALDRGAQIRPRNKTIGVSGALEAVKIDQIDPAALRQMQQPRGPEVEEEESEEEAGVVPGQMADRIDALRERLKQHNRTPDASAPSSLEKPSPSLFEKKPAHNPFAAKAQANDEEEEDSTTQMSVAEISGLLDAPHQGLGGGATEAAEDSFIESSEQLSSSGGESLMDSLFPSDDEPQDVIPAFIGSTSSSDNSIDFSRLEKSKDERTEHSGLFAESASKFVPQDDEPEQFQTSNSLLIQMDSIQKQGRSKRVTMIMVAALIFCALGVVAVIAAKNAQKDGGEEVVTPYDPGKKELVFNRYGEEELALYEMPGEEVISADSEIGEEEPESANDTPEVKSNGSKKPVIVARNDVGSKKNTTGPDLRGMGSLLNSSSKQDDALNNSSSKGSTSGSGLSTKAGSAKGVQGGGVEPATAKKSFGGPNIRTTGSRQVSGPKFKGVDTSSGSKDERRLGDAGTLSPGDAKKGFKKVSRSVQSCHQRQVTRGLPLDAPKVHLTLEIKGDGSVSSLKIEPSSVRSSEFATCLESHRKSNRWPFAEFGGKTLKIRHTYVLQ